MSPPRMDWSKLDTSLVQHAFFKAVIDGNLPVVEKVLTLNPHLSKTKEYNTNSTALMFAVQSEDIKMTKLLIAHGADLYAMNDRGKTVFDIAKKIRHPELLKILMAKSERVQETPASLKAFNDDLTHIIKTGDVNSVRSFFDRVFWQQQNIRPTWEHLQIALEAKDKPMMKILVTWGAKPTKAEWHAYTHEKDDALSYAFLLRSVGVTLYDLPKLSLAEQKNLKEKFNSPKENLPHFDLNKIPDQWKTVLAAFQKYGAPEAGIAGGALRDLYNGKKIKDVDLFLFDKGSRKKNIAFIKKVFKKAQIEIPKKQLSPYVYFGDDIINPMGKSLHMYTPQTRAFKENFNIFTANGKKHTYERYLRTESWHIPVGNQRTDFNIIFIDKAYKMAGIPNMRISSVYCTNAASAVLEHFDLGICQIAYNGTNIAYSEKYKQDIKNKTITWTGEPNVTAEHVKRVKDKYPDHTLCDDLKRIIHKDPSNATTIQKNKPPEPKPRSGTSDAGAR